MPDFMILQISHPLLSLFTLLPLWLMKLWNVSRLGIYLLYHVLHIANKPLNKNRYFVFNLRSEELWTWWFTHFHVSPQTYLSVVKSKHLNPNNSFELYKNKNINTKHLWLYDLQLCRPAELRLSVCVLRPTFYQ